MPSTLIIGAKRGLALGFAKALKLDGWEVTEQLVMALTRQRSKRSRLLHMST